MKKQNPIPLAALVFIIISVVVVVVLLGIGKRYANNLALFGNQAPHEAATVQQKIAIKKIRINDQKNCYDVTPDGVVRIYAGCGGDLTDATRPADSKHILELFKLASENDLNTLATGTGPGKTYEITVETDTGTKTYTIFVSDQNGGSIADQISQTITEVINDSTPPKPTTTPTPLPGSSPTAGGFTPSPTPGGVNPSNQPGATTTPGASDVPFSCSYTPGTSPVPYRVSNTVCTDQPQ